MRPWMARVALIPVLLWVVATLSFFSYGRFRAVPSIESARRLPARSRRP